MQASSAPYRALADANASGAYGLLKAASVEAATYQCLTSPPLDADFKTKKCDDRVDRHCQWHQFALFCSRQRHSPKMVQFTETNFGSGTIERFCLTGSDLGVFGNANHATGLAFDNAGNLYVSSDGPVVYKIDKFTPDGSVSVFASGGLRCPHGLAFDKNGNLYVASPCGNTIEKFTPDGVGTEFANADDGLDQPIDLIFDSSGNLFVSNAQTGTSHTGSVLKFTPDGVASVFADAGFHTAFGLAFAVERQSEGGVKTSIGED